MKLRTVVTASLLLGIGLTALQIGAQGSKGQLSLQCKHIAPIAKSYLTRHVNFSEESKNLESRTVDQFIKRLDSSKIYLLKSDVDHIKTSMNGIFQKTGRAPLPDCNPIVEAQELFLKRLRERVTFAKVNLDKSFKFDPGTELVLDPEFRDYPKNSAEADKFQLKYIQFQVSSYMATDMQLQEAKEQVIRSYERLLRRYEEAKREELWSNYLDSFARALDPHSSYLSADQLEDFEIQMRLSLEGIGATLSSQDGFTVIEQLIPGGAAARSGNLKTKDKIIAVAQGEDGKFQNVIEMDLRDVVRLIRGQAGSKVRLTVLRKSSKEAKRFEVTLIRDKIKLEDDAASITYIDKEMGGEKVKVALLNLPSFYADSRRKGRSAAKDMKVLLKEARDNKAQAVLLDLSTNGGGSLDDAVKIAGLFFKTGNVVKQSSRDVQRGEIELADEDSAVDWPGPLVVLISRISASASEIVAGTLKDYKRAVIVGGDHTFGKGTVQSVEPLPVGLGALKTTVGMFFTSGGNSTQHRGVDSDIVFPSSYSTDDIGEKTLDYSLPPKSIPPFLSSEAFVKSGNELWREVDPALITFLSDRAKKRVATSEDFKKIEANVLKAKKKGKAIKISEIMADREEAKKDKGQAKPETPEALVDEEDENSVNLTREQKKERYLKRADIQEAVSILHDMVVYNKGVPMKLGQKPGTTPSVTPESKPEGDQKLTGDEG